MAYTPKNNFNFQMKRTDAGEVGFRKKLLAETVDTCNDPEYYFRINPTYDSLYKSDSKEISVVGGVGDFSWSIIGSGFSLASATTSARTNTVSTDATVSTGSSAVVTVVDSCGNSISSNLKVCYNPCDDITDVSWDDVVSPETISPDDSVVVAIADGKAPYSWSVEGTGFTFANATTTELTNTLITDNIACGSGIMTVLDACGKTTTGYIRSTIGQWVNDFSIEAPADIPIPAGWTGTSCSSYCGAGGSYYGNWRASAENFGYFTNIHRSSRNPQLTGWCYSEGCADFAGTIYTFDDGYQVTLEELIIQDTGLAACPRGCLGTRYNVGIGFFYGQRWKC